MNLLYILSLFSSISTELSVCPLPHLAMSKKNCAAKNWEKRLTFLTNANSVLYAVRTESMSCTCLTVTQQFAGGNIKCQAKLNLVFPPLSTTRQGQPAVRKLPMQHITIYLMSYHVKWINFYQIKLICCI